ncbi:MAG: hypothetical protein Q8P23_01205 [bacterium]|nr:hypothetical protein [bacterium]
MDTLLTTPNAKKPQPSPEATAGAAKQYIRTFHGDVEIVKKGGTPNLVPLEAEQPLPVSAPLRTVTIAPGERFVLQDRVVEESPRPAEAFGVGGEPSPIETYAGDFTERMDTMQASTATVLAAEQDSAPMLVQVQPPKFSRSSILYSIAGGILIIASGVGAYIAYTRYIASSAPIVLTPGATAPIFVDDREPVDGTGTALLQAIQQSVASQLASGSVRLLYLETATSTSIFSALQLSAPGALLRNVRAVQSMAGVVNVGGVQSPFFILSVSSYSNTFAGMLLWEKTMPRDLAKLYPPYPSQAMSPSGVASTTAIATTTSVAPITPEKSVGFFDATVANHDVRVYRDSVGRDVVLYGYWNQTTLIIARNAAAFSEIIGRLATSRTP